MALFFYKEKNKGIRAAAYLRLSIEDGDKAESNSIGNQRELIRDFAAERPGLHLVEEYADDGYTGTNFERPGFKRMMEDIKSGKINCIIVKDLSRLGRNYIEMGKYLEQIFPMMGIRFIAINDNYDNANSESSDSDSIVVPFKNLLNDSYCRDISIKVRSQLDMKRRKGEFIGGYAIYGYCKDERNKNRLVVDEYAADIVRSIYRRKLEGMSAQAIAEQLNSENVLAPSEYKRLCGLNYHSGFKAGTHAKWQAIQVLRILKNEVYTGTMVQGRRQKINYKIKKIRDVEESGWIRVPNMHEAIIPQKLFDTVQEVLKLDTCASKGQQTVNLFSGIVRCGGCGQNMVRRTVSKNGKKYIYLHCVTNHNGLGCSSHLISERKLAEVVLAALQGKVQQISGLEHRLDEINEIPKNERRLKSVEEHLKMLEQEEQKYQTLRRQLYEDMSNGIVSQEEYKEFSHSFNEKVETIRKAKAEMNRQRDCLNNLDVEHLPWIEDFKSYQNLTSLNRRVLVELVESITVYDNDENVPVPSVYNKENKAYGKETTYTIAPVILWDSSRVWKILTAYVYTGAMVLGKTKTLISGKSIIRTVPKGQRYITEGTHEAIVSREEFEKAQLVIKSNSHKVLMGSVDFPLKGKVRCGNCRRVMAHNFKQVVPTFWCREGLELVGQTQCTSEVFQVSDIENAVFQALKKELSLLDSLYGDIQKEEQDLKDAHKKANRRKTLMEQELKNLKGEKMRMYEEYAAGTLPLDTYKQKKQECDRRISEMQEQIEQFKAEESVQSVVPGTVRAAAEQAENFLHGTRLTAGMVSAFIENVFVHDGGRIVVRFKYEQSIQDTVKALHTG